ncbi:MAG: hypothetical protein ABI946_01570 [Chthoniobacterales bacterium]
MIESLAIAVVGAIIGGFATWLFGIPERRRGAAAEIELKETRRRRQAPFLAPSAKMFQNLYESEGGQTYVWTGDNVLCWNREEMPEDTAEGTPVFFVIENRGQGAERIEVKLDRDKITLGQEPDLDSTNDLTFFKYPYQPAMRGKRQIIEITFESQGVKDTHRYETFHGRRALRRIDPE